MNVDIYTASNLPSPDSVGQGGVIYDGSRLRVSDGDNWLEDVTILDDLTVTDDVTVLTGGSVAIADADTLTVGGTIVPQQIEVSYSMLANGSLVDQTFFLANRAYQVVAVREVHSVAGTDGGTVSLQVTKDTTTNAPGAGADLLTNNTNAGFNLKSTANTVQVGTLTATGADLLLAAGDRLAVDYAGTLTTLAGVLVTVALKPV